MQSEEIFQTTRNEHNSVKDTREKGKNQVTWDQALFSFRFENYIPAGKAKPLARTYENR